MVAQQFVRAVDYGVVQWVGHSAEVSCLNGE
jgi:hypothetical protein